MALNYSVGSKAHAQSLNMAKTQDMGGALRMGYENGRQLLGIIGRVRMVADHLCGGLPRAAGDDRAEVGAGIVGQMTSFFRAEQDALVDLSNELARIESALGLEGAAAALPETDVAMGIVGRPY